MFLIRLADENTVPGVPVSASAIDRYGTNPLISQIAYPSVVCDPGRRAV